MTTRTDAPLLEISGLRVELASSSDDIVDEVDLVLAPGEVLGLVGESGCGKTTVGMALLGHTRVGARIGGGSILIEDRDLTSLSPAELRSIRGSTVSYIPQDPPTALNPALRIGKQLREVLETHDPQLSRQERETRLRQTLEEVALPADPQFLRRYPHQLSGGQQQRVVIAMAFLCRPRVLVCDEPTTGLDVTTQARVLTTIRELCKSHSVAAIYVSHDLAVVSSLADRVAVMYAGRIVEQGTRDQVFLTPSHPYTRLLMRAIPRFHGTEPPTGIAGHAPSPGDRPTGCAFVARCPVATAECHEMFPDVATPAPGHLVRCFHPAAVLPRAARNEPVGLPTPTTVAPLLEMSGLSATHGTTRVLHEISLELAPGECLALVGESGSGKTTTARCVAGLHHSFSGSLRLAGQELAGTPTRRSHDQRRRIQYIFQNPYGSLNPRHTIGHSVSVPLKLFHGMSGAAARNRVSELLDRVALPAAVANRFPDELSGGERQRVAIARALAAEPDVLLCDEVTSALDVSVQATIIELLQQLRTEMNLSLLFVTHNLALIRTIADRVAVMSQGRIIETGPVEQIFHASEAEYTRQLLANTPHLDVQPDPSLR